MLARLDRNQSRTRPVAFEVADPAPPAFVAVTLTRSRKSKSAVETTYVFAVAPEMPMHEPMAVVLHRSHWYAKFMGAEPVHVPSVAVSVRPTRAWPLIVGSPVFRGRAST